MMAKCGIGCAPDRKWFGEASYLGFCVAPNSWGPWTQIHEDPAWMTDNDPPARVNQPQISPKWIAADGKSLWLEWNDLQQKQTNECLQMQEKAKRITSQDHLLRLMSHGGRWGPYFEFNTQCFDLVIS